MKELSHKQIEAMFDAGLEIYVRWSRGPKFDKTPSRDYANGGSHSGLSAVKIGNWADEYMVRRLAEYRFLRMKDSRIRPYIYTGECIGLDSDGYESLAVESAKCIGVWDEKN